ncbi:MAG: YeeE/YedE family protein [Thalassospira sp.]|uniref:YeeE/YedE family protein n=1 Tax=Thalassospira sp. GB04J01 TaxID=1485225 RepID=UPI000C0F25B0|nr:YeeE/YedE family protein [Thalassospira sp. GB04J01]MBV17500.1 YeeE/YedE family protein [Thalassospira sp.]|tara:strand:+ start:8484 stop:8924 length:441 start_codon:yes stop_codon:yes gene_type:complete
MENFTPVSALIGGGLIGLASGMYLLLNGRIAGISGIVGGLLGRGGNDAGSATFERLAFVIGLIAGPFLLLIASPITATSLVTSPMPIIVIGGLLVGFGTTLGSGCTSGHGICGLSRFSTRSLVATLSFMGAGFVTVLVTRHLIGGL